MSPCSGSSMMHPLQLNLFLHSLRMIFLLIFGLIPYERRTRTQRRASVNHLSRRYARITLAFLYLSHDRARRTRAYLHRRPTLASVALLHSNVNVVVLHGIGRLFLLLFALYFVAKVKRFVRKGIVRCDVVQNARSSSVVAFVVESTASPFERARAICPSRHPRPSRDARDGSKRSNDRCRVTRASMRRSRRSRDDTARDAPIRTEAPEGSRRARRPRARDATRDDARDADEATHQKRGRRPYMSRRSPWAKSSTFARRRMPRAPPRGPRRCPRAHISRRPSTTRSTRTRARSTTRSSEYLRA